MTVESLLVTLGEEPAPHQANFEMVGVSPAKGKEIVMTGRTTDSNGHSTSLVSKYFNCLACHNVVNEEPDLAHPDPQERLEFARDHGLPYLQGSPLYGIVNRRNFYNGDYDKKYGDLVEPTRNNLREAIQLCATQCSQGRKLEIWELESVLAYLWTIGLKVEDLHLTEDDEIFVENALNYAGNKVAAADLIKSKYLDFSPATFIPPPTDRKKGTGFTGIPSNGQLIYELSCQHCHYYNNFSFLILDNNKKTFKYLRRKAKTYHPHSTYQVVRYGTSPHSGKRAYMPQYTQEKLSDQQLADLISFYELASR